MKKYCNLVFIIIIAAFIVGVHLYSQQAEEFTLKKIYKKKNALISELVSDEYTNNPGAEMYEVKVDDEVIYFYPVKKGDELLGLAIESSDEGGYNGVVKVMVGINQTGSISGISILEHYETEGFGTLMEEPEFRNQFKSIQASLYDQCLLGDSAKIDAIAGATISSTACCRAVEKACKAYMMKK